MELPAHEVLQSLQTLLSSSQIAIPTSNVASLPKSTNASSSSYTSADGGNCHGMAAPTPPEGDQIGAANGPPTPTHSERLGLEAELRRGKQPEDCRDPPQTHCFNYFPAEKVFDLLSILE